jgi:hypothetical protein
MPRVLQPDVLKQSLIAILVGLVIAGAAAGGWFYGQHHFWTALQGPAEVTLEQLSAIENPSQLPSTWVKVAFEKSVKTDVKIIDATRGDDAVEEEYLLFQAGDRWMIAIVKPNFQGNVLSGQVYHNSSVNNNEAFAAIYQDYQQVHQGKLFPFEFHAEIDYGSNWKAFAIVMGAFAGVGALFSLVGCGGVVKSFRPADHVPATSNILVAPDQQSSTAATQIMSRILRDVER